MKFKKKHFLTVGLALLAVIPVAAAAGAQNSTVIKAGTLVPDIAIEVTLPSAVTTYLNPKKISIKTASTRSDDQILSNLAYLENKSQVPVSVTASVTGAVKKGSSLQFSDSSTTGETEKMAYVYFEMQTTSDVDSVSWGNSFDDDCCILVSEDTVEKENIVVLDAREDENDTTSACYGAFRLTGDCVADPEDDPWTSKDSITATIVFTFKPLPLDSKQ